MTGFRPVIIHYHLFPGGVTSLISKSLLPLARAGFFPQGLTFLVGTLDKSEAFFEQFKTRLPSGFPLTVEVLPELNYWNASMGDPENAARILREGFKRAAGKGGLIWAHNPTLGKNPAYLLALKRLAEEEPERPILMHVHDSAEQGRWPNLGMLNTALPFPRYFVSPGTRWLTINRTDYDAFLKCGMPAEHLVYFPDVIAMEPPQVWRSRETLTSAIGRFAESNRFHFDPALPYCLVAGRTIRRKNILETLLVCLCAPRPTQLLVTLPADSPDDRPFETMVSAMMRKHKSGVLGFGPELTGRAFTLADLAREAASVMSASVMEGFGMPYLEFSTLGAPLFARRISTMKDFSSIVPHLPHHYYDTFKVPLSRTGRERQRERYFEKVRALSDKFRIRGDLQDQVNGFFDTHFSEDYVDFSYLSASEQFAYVDNLTPSQAEDIRFLNLDPYSAFDRVTSSPHPDAVEPANAIAMLFSPRAFQTNLEKLLKTYSVPLNAPQFHPEAFQSALFENYFAPENLRLLLDYKPYLATMI